MPIPRPRKGEKQKDFVPRCHEALSGEYKDEKQRHAVCMSAWRDRNKSKNNSAASTTAGRLANIFTVAQDVEIRTEELNGIDHTVVPLIALVEGVYQCANCAHANLYPASEFGKNVGAWNGRPATISHPMRGGAFVSAGSPDVWQNERIGTIFNAFLDGDKLRCEAWLDPEAIERAGEDAEQVMAAIEDGQQIEVSTAAWIDEQPRFGTHRGRKFEGVQVNFQPDHIAILRIGEIGACNWQDGCGVRVAQASMVEPHAREAADVTTPKPTTAACDCPKGKPCGCAAQEDGPAAAAAADAEGLEAAETARNIESALAIALENEYGRWTYVLDWDEQYVYFVAESQRGIRRRAYTLQADGSALLGDQDDERVRPRTEFVVVNSAGDQPGDDQATTTAETDQPEAGADGTTPPEDDMTESKNPAAAAGQQPPADPTPESPNKAAETARAEADAPARQLSSSDKRIAELEAENEHLKGRLAKNETKQAQTVDEYIDQAPIELRHSLMQLHKQTTRRRLELIDLLKAAPGCMFGEAELQAKPMDELEKLAGLAARTDYSVQPPARSTLTHQEGDGDFAELPESVWQKPFPTKAS